MCFSSQAKQCNKYVSKYLYLLRCDWVVRVLTSWLYVPKVLNFRLLAHFFAFIFVKSPVIEFRKVGTIYGQTNVSQKAFSPKKLSTLYYYCFGGVH